jgi:hypothetical protein
MLDMPEGDCFDGDEEEVNVIVTVLEWPLTITVLLEAL